MTKSHSGPIPPDVRKLFPRSYNFYIDLLLRNIDFEHPQESDIPSLDDSIIEAIFFFCFE